MLSCSRCLTIACAVLSLAGCGDEAPSTPLGGTAGSTAIAGGSGLAGGGSGVGGSASAGSGSVGGSGGGAGQSSAAGTSAGGVVSCSNYKDADGYKLTVHIKNSSSGTLYLGPSESTCEGQSLFQVADGANDLLVTLAGCHTSCQALMQTGPVTCPLACPAPSTVALNAGQTIDVPWDGRYAITQTLPAACMPASVTAPGTCVQAESIKASSFTFSARAGKKRQCLDASGTCACTPNADGTCTAASSVISGTIITTELFMKLEPGDVNPGGSGPYIALEFKD